jgi:hypothetical protein
LCCQLALLPNSKARLLITHDEFEFCAQEKSEKKKNKKKEKKVGIFSHLCANFFSSLSHSASAQSHDDDEVEKKYFLFLEQNQKNSIDGQAMKNCEKLFSFIFT